MQIQGFLNSNDESQRGQELELCYIHQYSLVEVNQKRDNEKIVLWRIKRTKRNYSKAQPVELAAIVGEEKSTNQETSALLRDKSINHKTLS